MPSERHRGVAVEALPTRCRDERRQVSPEPGLTGRLGLLRGHRAAMPAGDPEDTVRVVPAEGVLEGEAVPQDGHLLRATASSDAASSASCKGASRTDRRTVIVEVSHTVAKGMRVFSF